MTPPNDFNTEFGDKDKMPADVQEYAPGVYVRDEEQELPKELDMLWSGSRAYPKEDRTPLVTFLAGLVVGALITSAVFLLIVMRPKPASDAGELLKPIHSSSEPMSATPATGKSVPGSAHGKTGGLVGNSSTYTVHSGDTLGSIALKVYGSADLKFQQKIQRANTLSNPNKLKLDQVLTIPPKEY